MATPLTDGINALTAYANEVTGASDTTLSDAIESLVAGYGGEGDSVLWKTVTLEEDHATDRVGTTTYWMQFLEIQTQEDKQDYTWSIVFQNNTITSIAADFICGTYSDDTLKAMTARDGWSNISTALARSMYASAGTTIYVFKLPR